MFAVINADTNEPASGETYPDAQAANAAAAALRLSTGQRHRIARVAVADWVAREAAKMAARPLPACVTTHPAWVAALATITPTYPHLASDGQRVAYTPSAEHGSADRQTVTDLTTYLARFTGLQSQEISRLSGLVASLAYPLHLSAEGDEIERVYEAGPDVLNEDSRSVSCMAYLRNHYHTARHPSFAYGGGSMAIAWLTPPGEGPTSATIARAMVDLERRTFVRVYGNSGSLQVALAARLEAEGYQRASNFEGSTLALVAIGSGYVLVPYVDGNASAATVEDGKLVICHRGPVDVHTTGGRSYNSGETQDEDEGETFWCEYSEEDVSENDHNPTTVETSDGAQTWSDQYTRRAFYCEGSEMMYSRLDYTSVDVHVRHSIHPRVWCAETYEGEYFTCDRDGLHYSTDDYNTVEVDGEMWCAEASTGEYFICADCGEAFPIAQRQPGDLCRTCYAAAQAEAPARPRPATARERAASTIPDARQTSLL